MSNLIHCFLNYQLTPIPGILECIFPFYSNATVNAATWACAFWLVLHATFEKTGNIFLKKQHFKEYMRKRLLNATWDGFFQFAFIWYSVIVLWRTNVLSLKSILWNDPNLHCDYSGHFILMISFVAHRAIWNFSLVGAASPALSDLFMALFFLTTYFSKMIVLPFCVFLISDASKLGVNLVRGIVCFLKEDYLPSISRLLLSAILLFQFLSHALAIPFLVLVPLLKHFLDTFPCVASLSLNVSLGVWFVLQIISSPAYKLFLHEMYHSSSDDYPDCLRTPIECALFLPRTDDLFYFEKARDEILLGRLRELQSMRGNYKFVKALKVLLGMPVLRSVVEEIKHSPSEQLEQSGLLDHLQQAEEFENDVMRSITSRMTDDEYAEQQISVVSNENSDDESEMEMRHLRLLRDL